MNDQGHRRRHTRTLALLMTAILALTACLPGGGDDEEASDGGTAEAQTGGGQAGDPSQAGADELVVWDIYVRGAERDVAEQLTSEFEEEHGVTVTREPKNLDDLKATLPLAMGQDDGPDVASVNQGRADMGAIVAAGGLMDLTEFGREQGWFDTWGENLLARNMFDESGEQFGTGNLYGVAPQAEIVGWFYNRDTFDEHGLEPPTTFDELEQLLATLKDAGETPITFGNLDAWPAIHTYGAIEHTFVDTGYLNSLIFDGDVSFDTQENARAAETLQRWAQQGYFTENFSGISYDDSWAQFAAGDGALLLTGSWIAGELDPEQVGFFLTPGDSAGALPPQTGGMGVPLAVRASTDAPELARQYVAWMTSERAAEVWAEAWLPSRTPAADAVADDPLMGDLVGAWDQVLAEEQLGHYLDWATPTFYDALTAQLQELLAERTEPQAFVEALQADYAQSSQG
jgi:raffinose/stachyose/melibiose transport system substrate-binding protein